MKSANPTRWTYGELADRVQCFASGLHEMGYCPGQRLGVRLDNSAELLVTLLGSALTGRGGRGHFAFAKKVVHSLTHRHINTPFAA